MQKFLAITGIVVGLLFAASGLDKALVGRAALAWPMAQGRVLKAEREAVLERRRDGVTPNEQEVRYRPRVTYVYSVAGRSFTNSRFAVDEPSMSEHSAQSIVRKFPVGSEVVVQYRPDDPAYSVLEPGDRFGSWVVFAAGCITVGWGVIRLVRPKPAAGYDQSES